MPKYDAFGREIGEDTLAAWREQEARAARPEEDDASPFGDAEAIVAPAHDDASPFGDAEPTVAPAHDAPPPVTDGDPVVTVGDGGERTLTFGDATVTIGEPIVIDARPSGTRDAPPAVASAAPGDAGPAPEPERVIHVQMPRGRRRRPRVVSRLILLLVVIGLGGTLAVNAGREIEDAIRDVPGLAPVAPDGAPDPVGLQAGSLIRPAELRRALAELRDRGLGRVQTLRLAPERIDAAFLSRSGVLESAQLAHDGGFQEFASTPGLGHLETISWGRLNPAAPARLVRQAARRLNRSANQINYLVPSLIDGKVIWGAYFKGGQIFQGDARGRLFRRVS
jgi:hypothetical protein